MMMVWWLEIGFGGGVGWLGLLLWFGFGMVVDFKYGFVGGVILDESVLFQVRGGAGVLVRKLHRSNIQTAICYGLDLSAHKVSELKRMAVEYSCECFLLNASMDDAVNQISTAWSDVGGSILYVVSHNKDSFRKLNCHWLVIVVLKVLLSCKCSNINMEYIHLMTFLYVIVHAKICKRGAFPMYPTPSRLIFLPLTFEIPLSSQLKEVDVILHKATDEIVSIELGSSSESCTRITYTTGMQEVQRFMEDHSDFVVIDPLDNIFSVLDRHKIQLILLGLQDLNVEGCCTIRAPHFLKVNNFSVPDLAQRLSEAKLSFPSIVKPQVACGVADAHSMAIVFGVQDFKDLSVPLPAVLAKGISSFLKIFVFGVLSSFIQFIVHNYVKQALLCPLTQNVALTPVVFEHLKSQNSAFKKSTPNSVDDLDLGLVKDAAKWLAEKLDLTIFGFDVVIQEGTGDHVIVDVNYLPSFKEVPKDIAIPAFWDAIKTKFESRKTKRATRTLSP
ncbi:hypothetical protein EZV62_001547 [Acer yangbiense]|uniref:inositol-1,3,4-trisphosphate 5/6-kinase n=1 Tax=Acer yangbiense TaxID=1000413 RepID=A0A5C7IV65_9ROSI|nr:hypothetical protein EZV62_001547 [Acer yangbiense]